MKTIIIDHFSRRKEFIQMLAERKVEIGVEVGTDHGKYAEQLLAGIPTLRILCVDPWTAYTEGNETHTQEEMNSIYESVLERLRPYKFSIDRMTSMESVNTIQDNSLDFVFIDGNHSYDYVLEDITEWTKKVKPGGIIAGHDYKVDPVNDYGVIEAVTKYVEDNHIAPLFILRGGGRLVDCFMFFKQ